MPIGLFIGFASTIGRIGSKSTSGPNSLAMNLPKYRPGPVEYWIGEAITEFINGFIAGLGGGSVVGVGVGATQATTTLGVGSSPLKQFSISIAALILSAVGNGLKRVIIWHDKTPFPNLWPKPSDTNQPPLIP